MLESVSWVLVSLDLREEVEEVVGREGIGGFWGVLAAMPIFCLALRFLMTFLVEVLNTIPLVVGVFEVMAMDKRSELEEEALAVVGSEGVE